MRLLRTMLVTTCGLGFLRPAPGTWGSMPPCAMVAILLALGASPTTINAALLAVLILFTLACLLLGAWAETEFGTKDASFIVADETAGQCLPLLFLPASAFQAASVGGVSGGGDFPGGGFTSGGDAGSVGGLTLRALAVLATAFVLFRIMDIVKPPPARGLQRLRGGLGVLIDDLIAGLYAAILTQLAARFLLPLF